jgi:crotonobetainyl-CoA:carnitine CoA-transferase CaiB-like acyl-CoA transferase
MPLSSYRVIEIGTGAALAYAGKLFAAFGADVIKVEPPGGDPAHRQPPLVEIGHGDGESAYFAWLNVGKQSACIDEHAVAGLLHEADVLLDARPPGAGSAGVLAHAALRAVNPRLVIVAISWFGECGPYRDYLTSDATCRALAGLFSLIGPQDRPVGITDHQTDIVGGLYAYIAAMTGMHAEGGRYELSIHEAAVALSETQTIHGPTGPRKRLGSNRFAGTFPIGVYRCKRGWLGVGVSSVQQWRSFCGLFGFPELADHPNYAVGPDRAAHAPEIEALFAAKLLERDATAWFEQGLANKLPFAIVPEMHELLACKVFRDDGAFAPVQIGDAQFEGPAVPLRLTRTPPASGGVAPIAGSSFASGTRRSRPHAGVRSPANHRQPFAGTRIVDLTMGWAGPLVTRTMADLGAEVIKVEACKHPDWWRGQDPRPSFYAQKLYEKRPNYLVMNRNKIGITLDLTTREGIALVKRLVERADAVVENYSREVAPKLGLDYPRLRAVNPEIVMVSMPAFRAGPWETGRAYGFTLEQACGLPTTVGYPDGPPLLTHYAYGDPIGGLNAAAALMTALHHRERTGEGQHVDISQVECMLPMTARWMIEQSVNGKLAPRAGNRHPSHVPQNCFRCAGEDGFVHIAITDDEMWQRLCVAIDRSDLAADASLRSAASRRAREDEIEAVIERWTRMRDPDEVMQHLQRHRVAAGVVRSPYDLVSDPHLSARGHWQQVDRTFVGPHWQPSVPFRESAAPYPIRHAAPTLGEFNRQVLGGILGLTDAELTRLREIGVIGTEAIPARARVKTT